MAVGKEIRTKIKSVENTKKITKAMEMVAASKMRKAQERMRAARPYADKIRNITAHLSGANPEYRSPYMRASARAVITPLAEGSSVSSSGMSRWTTPFAPGKYMEPKAADSSSAATAGATALKTGLGMLSCGPMILATRVGAPTGGRPRWMPSVLSGAATSIRINSRIPRPVTARARPDSSQP